MKKLTQAILDDNRVVTALLLKRNPLLPDELFEEDHLHQDKIDHWIYIGDTALHLAAAGYRVEIIKQLLAAGADPNSADNHRRSGPLHHAADGFVTGPNWNAKRQVKTIEVLLKAGACINAQDKNGATPLHRAVRTRSAAAVKCLLDAGADLALKNKPGSTAFHLAVQNTGRGGSGEEAAIAAQREIIATLLAFGARKATKDGKGKTVEQSARSEWIREMLS